MTPRAALLLIALTGRCDDDGRPHVLCGTASRLRKAWFSPRSRCAAAAVLAALHLAGCAARETPAPLVIGAALCPEPAAPALPQVIGGISFDDLDQYDVFMERDDLMRGHIDALRRTVNCYRAQVK